VLFSSLFVSLVSYQMVISSLFVSLISYKMLCAITGMHSTEGTFAGEPDVGVINLCAYLHVARTYP
jgi:hypothetical protein